MTKFLPLFPLQLVTFPGEPLKLHIFEPRYKELINECRDTGNPFGIPAYIDGALAEFGTEMTLVETFKTYAGGEMDVLTLGLSVFRLEQFIREMPGKLYSGGDVTPVENDAEQFSISVEELANQYKHFHEKLQTGHARDDFAGPNLSFKIGHEVGLSLRQKVELLSITKESDRQLYILNHLYTMNKTLDAAEDSRRRVRGNGHFAKFPKLEL